MKRWFKRLALGFLITLLFFTVLFLGDRYSERSAGNKRLTKIEAELDARNPNWRIKDIFRANSVILSPGEESGTVVIRNVAKKLDKYETWTKKVKSEYRPKEPNQLWHDLDVAKFKELGIQNKEILKTLEKLPQLKPSINYHTLDVNNSHELLLKDCMKSLLVVKYLKDLASIDLNESKATDAVAKQHMIFQVSVSIGNEPFLIHQLVRVSITQLAVYHSEEYLAKTETPVELAELQKSLTQKLILTVIANSVIGERAVIMGVFDKFAKGEIDFDSLVSKDNPRISDQINMWLARKHLPAATAAMHEIINEIEDITKLPIYQQLAAMDECYDRIRSNNDKITLAFMMLPKFGNYLLDEMRIYAQTACAVTAIACERFRQANGRWPKSLEEIPKDILPQIPTDPFTGKPVMMRGTPVGINIYSTGKDQVDDGGRNLDPKMEPGTDIGFRLFDVSNRRIPAKEPLIK